MLETAAHPATAREGLGASVRYEFGLPKAAPLERRLDEESLPITQTRWETGGIRYLQSVLLTRLNEGEPPLDGAASNDTVLLVRITGECLAGEYTEATASFAAQVSGRPLELELREGVVWTTATKPDLVAAVEIQAGGVGVARGRELRFRGNMPPGTSGCMVFKIPLSPPSDEAAINRLRDLEFEEEARRVKRFWRQRVKTHPSGPLPVRLAAPIPLNAPSGGLENPLTTGSMPCRFPPLWVPE